MSQRRALPVVQGLLRAMYRADLTPFAQQPQHHGLATYFSLAAGHATPVAAAAPAAPVTQRLTAAAESAARPLASLLQFRGFAQPATAPSDGEESEGSDVDVPPLEATDLLPSSRRTGVIAIKAGMTQEWDHWGVRQPLTVLWIDDCQVVQVKSEGKEGYTALQLGSGSKRPKQLNGRERGHFNTAGVPLKRNVAEFRVSEDCILPVGTDLNAAHFVPGQFVDIAGTSLGKGFQGVMKRWGFAGGNASHGASKSHRLAGSTGGCQDPGKVWPGKKMAGRMGGKRRTVQNCFVFKVDPQRNLLYVRGQVPGHKGGVVYIKDSVKKTFEQQPPRPCPTHLGPLPPVGLAQPAADDPYDYKE